MRALGAAILVPVVLLFAGQERAARAAESAEHAAGSATAAQRERRLRVGASYVARYRSPRFPGAAGNPGTSEGNWRGWSWREGPVCEPQFTGFAHDPDCASSLACFRPNGRRDIAVGIEDGLDRLPLAGSYDSRDRDLLRYHVEIARAAGIDHFLFDLTGHTLAEARRAQGLEALNEEAFLALLDVVSTPGHELGITAMYEPKVHFLGWIPAEPTLADKKAGIVADLVHLLSGPAMSPNWVRVDGRPVLFLFRQRVCSPDGSMCLDDADWAEMRAAVVQATGIDPVLVADETPASGSVFEGLSRWRLVDPAFLRYRTFTAARDGVSSWPPPSPDAVRAFAGGLAEQVRGWVEQGPAGRFGVGVVWPGFDDTGVAGWGQPNLVGEDGLPLCVRVAEDPLGRFYADTTDAALSAGFDWIQIATWNDWNERTAIEPAWHPDLASPWAWFAPLPPDVEACVFGRLIETQQWIAAARGGAAEPEALIEIAREYMLASYFDPLVVRYD